jgi:AraC-like DNA-binding protein
MGGTQEIQRILSLPELTIRHTAAPFCEFEAHSHAALSVMLVMAGRMEVHIGEAKYEMSPGQIALTNISQMHSARASNVEFVSAIISPGLLAEVLSASDGDPSFSTVTGSEIRISRSVVSDRSIEDLLRRMAGELLTSKVGRDQMLDSIARQTVIELVRSHIAVRNTPNIELSRAGPVDRRLRRAIEFMHDHYGRDLSVEEIAAAAFLSEFHFARIFKQVTGMTPHSYLASIRLERARKLLLQTESSVSEIALAVGYQSQSHFTRAFKSATGVTPLAYRKSLVDLRVSVSDATGH